MLYANAKTFITVVTFAAIFPDAMCLRYTVTSLFDVDAHIALYAESEHAANTAYCAYLYPVGGVGSVIITLSELFVILLPQTTEGITCLYLLPAI